MFSLEQGDVDEESFEDEENEMVDDREEEDERENREEEQSEHPQIKEQDGQMSPDDRNNFRWYTVSVSGRDKILDLKLLEPYMKVISHGGKAAH